MHKNFLHSHPYDMSVIIKIFYEENCNSFVFKGIKKELTGLS